MNDTRAEAERLLVARLMATAKYHANWRELAKAEHDAAVTALRELAAGRADLLAEVAGLLEGFAEGSPRAFALACLSPSCTWASPVVRKT